jgi:hypothetical protein
MKYTTKIELDPSGEAYFLIPDDFWEQTQWEIDDVIEWIDNGDGSWLLRKKDEHSTLHNGL